MIVLQIFSTLIILVFVIYIYCIKCVRKAGKQRIALLKKIEKKSMDLINNHNDYMAPFILLELFDRVTLDQHYYALVFFRDPWELYDEELRKLNNGN